MSDGCVLLRCTVACVAEPLGSLGQGSPELAMHPVPCCPLLPPSVSRRPACSKKERSKKERKRQEREMARVAAQ